uniref:Uncharacterized protein n=1 Tax=Tanacetum cinerariifolium TaxID=118510 RepID=A0A699HIS1_TANCI|nr:hypothetical protein [Tanacetum cinerariifolium]
MTKYSNDDENIKDLKKITKVTKAYERKKFINKNEDKKEEVLNANLVFMEKMKEVFSYSNETSLLDNDTIAEVLYFSSDSESEYDVDTSDYYDKSELTYGLFMDNNDDQ